MTNAPLVIVVYGPKGGIGKSTTSANIGGKLADEGKRVLLVDADPRPNLTRYFNIADPAPRNAGFLELVATGNLEAAISTIEGVDLHLVASNHPPKITAEDRAADPLAQHTRKDRLVEWLRDPEHPERRFALRHVLSQAPYDVVIVDTAGEVNAITEASVLAADVILAPLPPQTLDVREFHRSFDYLFDTFRAAQDLAGIEPPKLLAFFNKVARRRDSRELMEQVREDESFAEIRRICPILETIVNDTAAQQAAVAAREPVHRFGEATKTMLSPDETMANLIAEIYDAAEV